MKKMLALALIGVFFCACDLPKRVAGYSIVNFEKEEKGRFAVEIALPPERILRKCADVIEKQKARVIYTNKKKNYLVADRFTRIFEQTLDSTEIGIFLTVLDNGNVKTEVISNNSRLAKFFSEILFPELKTIEQRDIERAKKAAQ